MRSKWSVLMAALGAGASALALAAGGSASPPMTATGTETFTLNPTCIPFVTCKTADGNMFITVANPGSKTGTFTGTQVFDGTLIVNLKDSSFNFSGTVTFTGTVTGCGTGTVVFGIEGAGYVNQFGVEVFTRDHQYTLFGKGTLAVHANLNSTGSGPLNYTGDYHC